MTEGPRVAVVVAAWGGTSASRSILGLAPSLRSLFRESCETVAVFNGPSSARDAAPGLGFDRWATLSENAGVARAWNIGWQLTLADTICFVNEDVRAGPLSLCPLLSTLDDDPGLAAVGPDGALWDMDAMAHRAYVVPRPGAPAPCDAVSGYLFAVRRAALRDAGGFDERFSPAGCEEIDMCFALQAAGWRIAAVACPGIDHQWGISAASRSHRVEWIGGNETLLDIDARSRTLLRAKWHRFDFSQAERPRDVVNLRWGPTARARARSRYMLKAISYKASRRFQARSTE